MQLSNFLGSFFSLGDRTRTARNALWVTGLLLGTGACADDAGLESDLATAAQIGEVPTPGPAGAPLATLNVPTTTEDPKVAPWFKVYRPVDMKAFGRPLPVIAWANGGCLRSSQSWEAMFQRWAGAGMVVLVLTPNPDWGAFGSFAMTNVADHRGMIDWALKQNEMQASPYAGLLDPKGIIAAGNSCGGVTALGAAAEDPRVNAVFVLSGSSAFDKPNLDVMAKIRAPVGYVIGGSEDIATSNVQAEFDLLGSGIPAAVVSRSKGDHFFVSTDTGSLADTARIALDWFDVALFRTPEAAATLKSPAVCTGCAAGTWTLRSKNF